MGRRWAGAVLASAALSCTAGEGDSAAAIPGESGSGADVATDPSPWMQTAFRVRSDAAAALNFDGGWAGETDERVEVAADRPFRIRFEVGRPADGGDASTPRLFGLQVRRNGGPWEELVARDFPYPDEISTPPVSVVATRAFVGGEATTDLLGGSTLPFAGGVGVSLDSVAASPSAGSGGAQSEWEWPVVVRRYADGAVRNEAGDTFECRMVDARGRPVPADRPAIVDLTVPAGHLGGTYPETPGVLGPWQSSDGSLYFPMEPAETFNVLMMVRSPDRGVTWSEVDEGGRPATDDLEGFATAWHDGRIYLLHQISEATYLHAFATGDAPDARDAWVVRDELVARHSEPPTQVAALVADPDGRLTAFYGDSLGLRHRVRGPDGAWGPEGGLDTAPGRVASGVMATRGVDGRIHVAYTASDGEAREVWYRVVEADGTVGPEQRLSGGVATADEDIGAVAPLVHLADTGATIVLYRLGDGFLYERTVRADGTVEPARRVSDRRVVQNGSDSDQVGADAVAHAGRVVVVFIDESTRDLWMVRRGTDGAWTEAEPIVEGVNAQWVRGRVVEDADGTEVYGLVFDAGSDGGSGMNRFVAIPLSGEG